MQSVGSCQPSVHKEDALRWEVLCVQGLWGGFSNKSAFMEHPVADSGEASCVQGVLTGIGKRTDRRAPDGSLREELCVCRECGQGSCDQSAFFTHCRENPYVGILWGCSSQTAADGCRDEFLTRLALSHRELYFPRDASWPTTD